MPAPALIATPGASNANSYATVADLKSYAATRFPIVPWVSTATDDFISAVLIAGARSLDAGFDWTGGAATSTQSMAWFRVGMKTRNGFPLDSTINPIELIFAQCELSLQLNLSDLVSDNIAAKLGVQSVAAGSVHVSFQSTNTSTFEAVDAAIRRASAQFDYLSMPAEVRRLLVPSWYREATILPSWKFGAFGGVEQCGFGFRRR